ncbi:ATP-binding SpoIIE family protein phosphatase [Actinomadura parmotrematis]|uniref:SpoIIE family protein phosphatase n=1 Tax=Actinomadura parmotrematis TaxID=2864039 RepID=A0ABS7FN98_9ACTN|nr:ATP-binding SpoIIE family protein phosphatase [Actinomadura parmotrematis]MBW8481858.1 SpoIIE family protein phosphatase [Actinomadura parmotrematis]
MDPLSGTGWTVSPPVGDTLWIRAEEQSSPSGVRRRATELAERIGFAGERLGQVQLAATEAATNLVKHASDGEVALSIVRDGTAALLQLVCVDRGPGMADPARSRLDGFSTSGTLGIGLGTIERLADQSGLYSVPGTGTVTFARFRQPGTGPGGTPPFAGLTRPLDGETECGDAFAVREVDGVVYALLCDGLGHGPLAARAAQEAVRAITAAALPARPADLLQLVHRRLAPTRGGAVAVAVVDRAARRVGYAGLGNVAGWIVGDGRRQGMISTPGIAGHQARSFREQSYELPPHASVVLHSDGLTDRWNPADRPGLFHRDPLLVAAALMRDAGVRHDDRSVLAVAA